LAHIAGKEGAELIVAVGGDGTLREVVNGIDFDRHIFGVIPAGTGNGFRRSLLIPGDVETALLNMARWKPRRIDVGVVNGDYFLNVVGVGFDAAVEKMASGKYQNLRGYFSYLAAFLEELTSFQPFESTVGYNGSQLHREDTMLIAVANGSYYGGRMCIAPRAVIDDGLLDLCLVGSINPPETTMLAVKALMQRDLTHSSILSETVKMLQIVAPKEIPVHVDGDLIGSLPLRISIKKQVLRVLAPTPAV